MFGETFEFFEKNVSAQKLCNGAKHGEKAA
jgi:hypothetical protein